jgi:hypothetical protein
VWLIAAGWSGILLALGLQWFAYPGEFASLQLCGALCFSSSFTVGVGFVAAFIHLRKKRKSGRRAEEGPSLPDPDALRLWGESPRRTGPSVQPAAPPPSDVTSPSDIKR